METRELIYNYIDLCNEQVFLRKRNRISTDTWLDWCSGMKHNLNKIAFTEVWGEIKYEAASSFSFLEKLEETGFDTDPINWTDKV